MRFKIDLHSHELPSLFERFVAITGLDPWLRRVEDIAAQVKQNPLLRYYVADRHGLELEFARLFWEAHQDGGRMPKSFDSLGRYELYAFMAGITRVYERLGEVGQRRLKGMLLDSLNKSTGLLPLQVEMTTAAHLRSQGFNVMFQDLEGTGRADLLAKREGIVLEIECGLVSCDIGRRVHRKDAATLGWSVLQQLDNIVRSATEGLLVLVRIDGRLSARNEFQRRIAGDIVRGILSGRPEYKGESSSISTWTFAVAESPFRELREEGYDQTELNDFVAKLIGRRNSEILFSFTPRKRVLALVIESNLPDRFLRGMERQISDKGKTQFTKEYPGVLVARLHDLTQEQLLDLATSEAPGFQWVAQEFFSGEARSHMMSLAFLANSRLRATTSRVGELQTTMTQGTGPAYVFHSKTHAAVGDQRFRVFQAWQS